MTDRAYNYHVDTAAFGHRIKNRRTEKNLSIKDMEEFFGISRQALYNWEKGKSLPTYDNLLALAKFLELTVDELLTSSNSEFVA